MKPLQIACLLAASIRPIPVDAADQTSSSNAPEQSKVEEVAEAKAKELGVLERRVEKALKRLKIQDESDLADPLSRLFLEYYVDRRILTAQLAKVAPTDGGQSATEKMRELRGKTTEQLRESLDKEQMKIWEKIMAEDAKELASQLHPSRPQK